MNLCKGVCKFSCIICNQERSIVSCFLCEDKGSYTCAHVLLSKRSSRNGKLNYVLLVILIHPPLPVHLLTKEEQGMQTSAVAVEVAIGVTLQSKRQVAACTRECLCVCVSDGACVCVHVCMWMGCRCGCCRTTTCVLRSKGGESVCAFRRGRGAGTTKTTTQPLSALRVLCARNIP